MSVPQGDPAIEVPMAEILNSLKAEIVDLAEVSDRLQELAGKLIRVADSSSEPSLVEDAQSLDSVVQRLFAISSFLHALAHVIPGHWAVDPRPAANLLTLSSLARRFAADGRPAEADGISGELDLF